ncbi:MAG: hypothetical protein M1308_13325 [Actinobacteria bacterium]|nr:hypothetical protein [Actinomycetota bacterium]
MKTIKKILNWIDNLLNRFKGKIAFIILASGLLVIITLYAIITVPLHAKVWAMNTFNLAPMPERILAKTNLDRQTLNSALQGTKMANTVDLIIASANHFNLPVELYLCVANAESSFNNIKKDTYNPFGILVDGKIGAIKQYQSWEHSINAFSQLIKYYYVELGLNTPDLIVNKYVGVNRPQEERDRWIKNCKQYYNPKVLVIK